MRAFGMGGRSAALALMLLGSLGLLPVPQDPAGSQDPVAGGDPVPVQEPPAPKPEPPAPEPPAPVVQDPLPAPVPAPGPAPVPAPVVGETPPGPAPEGVQPAVQEPAQAPPVETTAAPLPPPLPCPPGYHGLVEVRALLADWARDREGLSARPLELGTTRGGIPIPAFEFGAAGEPPLDARPAVLLIGALDGVSLAGAEAVLHTARSLLGAPADLPPGVTFVAVPWGSPDALLAAHQGRASGAGRSGANALPVDDDRDRSVDEDGPDDLDGDGLVLDMLIEDPEGPWARGADARFLIPARPGDAPRYRLAREGRDDDGDGRYNEDGPGGVVLDQSFPIAWPGPWSGAACGSLPLSEPEARALADLALGRKLAAALVFQGNHGQLAVPGAASLSELGMALPSEADRPAFQRAVELFARSAQRPGSRWLPLWEARAAERRWGASTGGAAADWLYAAAGALAFEVAPWGPELDRGPISNGAVRASYGEERAENGAPALTSGERAWARWLDDRRGGIGFTAWHPVGIGAGAQVLVGGWEPLTMENPPEDALPRALEGLDRFVRELAAGLPRLAIELRSSTRSGELVHLRARVRNVGLFPSGMGEREACVLSLAMPAGAQLLAGEPEVSLGHLPGGASSASVEWVVLCPENAPLRLLARDRSTLPVEREVRP